MRKIAATYIFPGNRAPIKNGILVCDNNGTVVEIIDTKGALKEQSGLEFYSGILVPGFVNAHCHLELSYLKSKIGEKLGIGNFLGEINRLRNLETENTEKEIDVADRKMWASGIVAVGDISNSKSTIDIKKKSKIFYHTFIESFGFHPSSAQRVFDYALFIKDLFAEKGLASSIVPHSPYSVSEILFQKICDSVLDEEIILSIHNQESKAEAQFFQNGTGPIAKHLQNNLGIDISHWKPTGESPLLSTLKNLPTKNQLLLVHNTFTQKDDLYALKKYRSLENTYFVVCSNSNLYIENQLPPVSLFRSENLNICLGTDSLASNRQLSILNEMLTLQQNFPQIELAELIEWATINGAKALKLDNEFGSFELGKKPGINLITGINFEKFKLTAKSKIKRLG